MTSAVLARLCRGRVHYAWIVLGVVFCATLALPLLSLAGRDEDIGMDHRSPPDQTGL